MTTCESICALCAKRYRFGLNRGLRELVFCLGVLLALAAVGPRSAISATLECELPANAKPAFVPLSDCITEAGAVVVGAMNGMHDCTNVEVDKSYKGLGLITISALGTLIVTDAEASKSPLKIETTGIDVFGTLEVGNSACPIGTLKSPHRNERVTITLTGTKPTCPMGGCAGFTKGIQVESGGSLRLYGRKGAANPTEEFKSVSWTYLALPAGPPEKYGPESKTASAVGPNGDTSLEVEADVTEGPGAWQPGDWIAIATTSFSPYETEFAQISALQKNLETGGTNITLKGGLKFYHFGGEDPGPPSTANYSADATTNYGVDERAEVGLISRSIKLTSDTPATGDSSHWGGETRFLENFASVQIQGVEFEKFGKDQLGSYPIHFHMDGDLTALVTNGSLLVDSNSIHHSYNKCITAHSTQGVTFTNNVCARIVGHIFYQELGDEANLTFTGNLGLGAMSNNFDINDGAEISRAELIKKYWWTGDRMVDGGGLTYDGFRIPDTGNQSNGTRGHCFELDSNGRLVTPVPPACPTGMNCPPAPPLVPPCASGTIYNEPPTGFWITNPSIKLRNNSIGGCQGEGKGYWYVPALTGPNVPAKFIPIGNYPNEPLRGEFVNNRVHGCYSGLYTDNEDIEAESLFGYNNADGSLPTNRPLMDQFIGLIATRNRFRGVWLRPSFFDIKDARLASNSYGAALVTSGGPDGNYPGLYAYYTGVVTVGESKNNVDRFGPCPEPVIKLDVGKVRGGTAGCIDQTPPEKGQPATGGDLIGNGYPDPNTNLLGYMIYDGPPLIFRDRFVNFKIDISRELTESDATFLAGFKGWSKPAYTRYEGDAALGWFLNNQSAYPTGTSVKQLTFTNVDLRHQVFTDQVNRGNFDDGDKNTTIFDLDGTLSNYTLVDNTGAAVTNQHPVSLNNLEINASGIPGVLPPKGSVDECFALGAQDTDLEGRPTANMSPAAVGALEFEALFPNPPNKNAPAGGNHTQLLTFSKDQIEFPSLTVPPNTSPGVRATMQLHSRNGQGVWEPKVSDGYGYTVSAEPDPVRQPPGTPGGIPTQLEVGLADVIKPSLTASNPFYVRMGICYNGSNTPNGHPANAEMFTVATGYKSWAGGGLQPTDQVLRQFYNHLDGSSNGIPATDFCFNLNNQNPGNPFVTPTVPGNLALCPSNGVIPLPALANCPPDQIQNGVCTCPTGTLQTPATIPGFPAICEYPKATLAQANTIGDLTVTDPVTQATKPDLTKYFYDSASGMLFFYVAQTFPNAQGPSPLGMGACTGNPDTDPYYCPSRNGEESYYVCPPQGCQTYVVTLNDSSYTPQASNCQPYPTYNQNPPADQFQLSAAGSATTRSEQGGKGGLFPHYVANTDAMCLESTP
jgi:hypothetical protein